MLTKNAIRHILQQYGLAPHKKRGQNFLHNRHIIEKIIACCAPDSPVIEIGPGLGNVTFPLAEHVTRLDAVEIDKGLFHYLSEQCARQHITHIQLHHADILKTPLDTLLTDDRPCTVVGNLPYAITGPALMYLLRHKQRIKRAILMLQKEAADRLIATHGSRVYGKISVFYGYFAHVTPVCTVAPNAFYPVPKVDSLLLSCDFHTTPRIPLENSHLFFELVKHAFSQRRKTIINALAGFCYRGTLYTKSNWETILPATQKTLRPECLSPDDYVTLANRLHGNCPA